MPTDCDERDEPTENIPASEVPEIIHGAEERQRKDSADQESLGLDDDEPYIIGWRPGH